MKIAPFIHAINNHNSRVREEQRGQSIQHILVHTGQHYDDRMSLNFFEQLNIPLADINLGIGSGTHAQQVGQTMIEFEKVVRQHKPDWVVVVGDVNATLACSVTAKKEWVKCCHIEAGLRSGDITMPEEVNRLVTDRLSDLLLTPDELSSQNLKSEGTPDSRICFVGNIMIDTLDANLRKAQGKQIDCVIKNNLASGFVMKDNSPQDEKYVLMTLHRPSNVDQAEILGSIVQFILKEVASQYKVLWPIHPRTRKNLDDFHFLSQVANHPNLILLEPLPYLEMLRLNMGAKLMLTDSGGLQEECTVLGTPCLTLRWNTERPITLTKHGGASVLVGNNVERIRQEYQQAIIKPRNPKRPPLWDGKTAQRCLDAILEFEG